MRGSAEHGHEPVMVEEVLGFLEPQAGQTILDCTAGRGGHAMAVAGKIGPGGTLIALDVDPVNLKYAWQRFEAAALPGVALRTFHANFAEAADVLEELGLPGVHGLLADLGVSTNQLTEGGGGSHGLSFNAPAALDMRLDPRIGRKASDLLAELGEKEIADILYHNADERFAYRIARKIVQTRVADPIRTTEQLARLVRSVVPASRGKHGQIDPATRTFQALRMAVNEEMERLEGLLDAVPGMMLAGGRAVFISFHSGEDRLVKQASRGWVEKGIAEVLTKKPVEPGEAESHANPRSRSAKLRAARFGGPDDAYADADDINTKR